MLHNRVDGSGPARVFCLFAFCTYSASVTLRRDVGTAGMCDRVFALLPVCISVSVMTAPLQRDIYQWTQLWCTAVCGRDEG